MNYINQLLHFIQKEKKQILFALFALICYIIDNSFQTDILKSGAPLVVATAAASGSAGAAATGAAATAGTVGAATKSSMAVAKGVDTSKKAANVEKEVAKAPNKKITSNNTTNNINTNKLKNTNPKQNLNKATQEMPNTTGNSSAVDEGIDSNNKKSLNNIVPISNVENEDYEEEENEVLMESASNSFKPFSEKNILGCAFISIFVFIISIPLLILVLINATSSTMSQIDCSMQDSANCIEEEAGILNKLKNLFIYGAYGSNSEVVLKEMEKSYEEIKEEYDFIINLALLSSSMFTDAEYIKTDVQDGKLVITDEMLERVEYIREIAELQMNPKFHIFQCSYSTYYNDETGSYETGYSSSYQYTTEDEEAVEGIPTAECNAFTVGGLIKKVTYYYDEEKYFERLEKSEELDLVYSDFVEADKLLVHKIENQYYLYNIFNHSKELSQYAEVPVELEFDENVNLSAPLKGWISITSPFGMRDGEYAGMHTGIDLVASNKNIYSAGNGVVTRSNVETEGGNVIEITHTDSSGNVYVTQYAHLSERLVNVGDIVSASDVIGIMGDTGTMASGVHLHFSMWKKDPYELLNPRKLFKDASNY